MATDLDKLWKIFDSINDSIKFSDAKAIAILATNGVIAGFYFSNIVTIGSIIGNKGYALVPLIVSLFFLSFSIMWSAYSLYPRIDPSQECDVLFFSDITKKYKNGAEYENAVKKSFSNHDAVVTSQLACQTWKISMIADKKYGSVKLSMLFMTISVMSSVALILTSV